MNDINIKTFQLEQSILQLINQSGLPIAVVELILKDLYYEVNISKKEYLMQIEQQSTQEIVEEE